MRNVRPGQVWENGDDLMVLVLRRCAHPGLRDWVDVLWLRHTYAKNVGVVSALYIGEEDARWRRLS